MAWLFACSGYDDPADIDSLRIEPASVLFVAEGETAQLTVRAFDANGAELRIRPDAWEVGDGGIASVDGRGRVTAERDPAGSTRVTAKVGDHEASALVWLAEPASGAVLYDDHQLVGEPEHIDGDRILGSMWKAELDGVEVSAGDLIVPRGSAPVMGEVVEVSGDEVTYVIVPLGDLFERLDVRTPVRVMEDVSVGVEEDQARSYPTGFFDCETDTEADIFRVEPKLEIPLSKVTFDIVPTLLKDRDGWIEAGLVARGSFTLSPSIELALAPEVTASMRCEATFGRFDIPVGSVLGPLGTLVYPSIPLGAGLEMEARVGIEAIEAKPTLTIEVAAEAGFLWTRTTGFETVHSFTPNVTFAPNWGGEIDPTRLSAKLTASAFATTGLDFSTAGGFFDDAQLLDLDAGLKQEWDLEFIEDQLVDQHKSKAELVPYFKISAGEQTEEVLELFELGLEEYTLEFEAAADPIARTPEGVLYVSGDPEFQQPFSVDVELSNTTYLGVHQVETVAVWGRHPDGTVEKLAETVGVSGQNTYTLQWVPESFGAVDLIPTVYSIVAPIVDLQVGEPVPVVVTAAQPVSGGILGIRYTSTGSTALGAYDASTGALVDTVRTTDQQISSARYSPLIGDTRVVWVEDTVDVADALRAIHTSDAPATPVATVDTISGGGQFDWSADGQYLTWLGANSVSSPTETLNVLELSTGVLTPLTTAVTFGSSAIFSPDGLSIAYLDDANRLAVIGRDGGTPWVSPNQASPPLAWMPDGSGVVTWDCSIVGLDGTSTSAMFSCFPEGISFSPDGAFVATWDGGDIFVDDLSSGAPITVATNEFYGGQLSWSPDSRAIVYVCFDENVQPWSIELCVADGLAGWVPQTITSVWPDELYLNYGNDPYIPGRNWR